MGSERREDEHMRRDTSERGKRNREGSGSAHDSEDQRPAKERKRDEDKGGEAAPSESEVGDPQSMEARDEQVVGDIEEEAARKAREEERLRLKAEAEKRRKRVEAWQAKRRHKEAEERRTQDGGEGVNNNNNDANHKGKPDGRSEDGPEEGNADTTSKQEGEASKATKRGISFEEEDDDEPDEPQPDLGVETSGQKGAEGGPDEDVDPLDAFMEKSVNPELQREHEEAKQVEEGKKSKADVGSGLSKYLQDESDSAPAEEEDEWHDEVEDDKEFMRRILGQKKSKAEKLGTVDHDQIEYEPFRKNFYIEAPEIASMSEEEANEVRKEMDGIKVRGKKVPKPIKAWSQAGLSNKVLDVLSKLGYEKPMPIQAQALPVIMSGRDCISVAKTGSGKTLAYALPMLRHVKDQRPLEEGEGPIALVLAPTRELVMQIAKEVKRFAKPLSLTTISIYGGGTVGHQISELKRGGETVVCTPGRMIDVLASSGGRVTNLYRVTYLVIDEGDRMFDMGFEPQISRIIQNTRPDRQTVMFSATFPKKMELLARSALKNPVELIVGGRNTVNPDIEQSVEVRPREERFLRLLELLGEWYEHGKVLVFVHTQDTCDAVFRELLRAGYPCLSLHGGKEQADRECTISDFKSDVCHVLVATSVAARGLDVPDLRLVVNYDPPGHREDYVHRVGRTGRAGNKGTAVTFIAPDELHCAPDVCKALRDSKQPIPEDLYGMEQKQMTLQKQGLARAKGSGYGGSGYKFDLAEQESTKAKRRAEAKQLGLEVEGEEDDPEEESEEQQRRQEEEERELERRQRRQQEAAAAVAHRPANLPTQPQPQAQAEAPSVAAQHHNEQLQKDATAHQPQQPHEDPEKVGEEAKQRALSAGATEEKAEQAARAARAMAYQQRLPPPKEIHRQQQAASQKHISAIQQAAASAVQRAGGQVGLQGQAGEASSLGNVTSMAPEQRARAIAAALHSSSEQQGAVQKEEEKRTDHAATEMEINDLPQQARWKVTHRETARDVAELTGCALTVRGVYVPRGKEAPPDERKLYVLIEGPSERAVHSAKSQLKQYAEQAAQKDSLPGGVGGGHPPSRYSVL